MCEQDQVSRCASGGLSSWARSALFLAIVWFIALIALFQPRLHGVDPLAYYSWVRTGIVDGDLDVGDEFARLGFPDERGRSSTGYTYNEWPVGAAVLWSPFFLTAHLGVSALAAMGADVSTDGYGAPYVWACALGSSIYALGGLLLVLRLCRRLVDAGSALQATVAIFLATPLVFYSSANPIMAHAPDLFINALFLTLLLAEEPHKPGRWLALGVVGGLACAVRPQNATLLVLALVARIAVMVRSGHSGRLAWRLAVTDLVALGMGSLVGASPQLIVWRVVFGHWLVTNPYAVAIGSQLDWHSPHLLQVLFSTNRGLFTWTPIAVPAVIGLVWLFASNIKRSWLMFAGANMLAQIYIVGSWVGWHGAASFGQRLLINSVPVLALGLAGLLSWLGRHKWGSVTGWVVVGSFAAWNLVLLARYGLGDVPRAGDVALGQLWMGQFSFMAQIGRHLSDMTQLLLTR